MEDNDHIEEITSELAFIGEQLSNISKYLRKLSNWTEEDEEKYDEIDECEDEEEN